MDSKSTLPTSYDEAAPPSYTETDTSLIPTLFPSSASSTSQYYSAQTRDQLLALTPRIRTTQTQRSLLDHANDERILAILAAQTRLFLSGFVDSGLPRGTLILVPAGGLQNGATPMEYDFQDPKEYDQVVRVRSKEDTGSGEWYWRNDQMAGRLARYLSPTPVWGELPVRGDEVPSLGRDGLGGDAHAMRQKSAMKQKEKTAADDGGKQGRSFFGFRKKVPASTERTSVVESMVEDDNAQIPSGKVDSDAKVVSDAKMESSSSEDKVLLDVKAEEVSFRTENDMGIFETQRGWAIVLKVKIELGRR
jgi:hypothetical protein